MAHPDPETLALIALGETASQADRAHLADCADCRDALVRFARPIAAARAADPTLEEPDPRVWSGIAAELGLGAAAPDFRPAAVGVRPRDRARIGRRTVAALATVGALLVAGGAAVGLLNATERPQRVAAARLGALPGWAGSSGTAVVERLPDGRRVIVVRTNLPPAATADHEVWLMTARATGPISLGTLTGRAGTFAAPAGVDLDRFKLVDVSAEPHDGDPAHSGDSIIRGALHRT